MCFRLDEHFRQNVLLVFLTSLKSILVTLERMQPIQFARRVPKCHTALSSKQQPFQYVHIYVVHVFDHSKLYIILLAKRNPLIKVIILSVLSSQRAMKATHVLWAAVG